MRKLFLALVPLLLVLAACAKAPSGRAKTVTVFMWSEYIDPALLERFEKETGQKVVLDTYENTETMMSKIASASDLYDVVVVSDHAVRTLSGKGTFRQLDLGKIPNAKNVMNQRKVLMPARSPTSGLMVASMATGTTMVKTMKMIFQTKMLERALFEMATS